MNNDHRWRLSNVTATTEITCIQCDELLDAYLDALLANVNVRARYPAIWHHLQRCDSCSLYYQALRKILHHHYPSPALPFPSISLTLPFLPRSQVQLPNEAQLAHETQVANEAEYPWRVELQSPLLGEPFLLRFAFSQAYLQNLAEFLQAAVSHALPLANALFLHSPPCLLLAHIPLNGQTLLVKLVALWTPTPMGLVRLQATLSSPAALPRGLQATLQWGALTRTCPVSQTGGADLGQVPIAALKPIKSAELPVLVLTFATSSVDPL